MPALNDLDAFNALVKNNRPGRVKKTPVTIATSNMSLEVPRISEDGFASWSKTMPTNRRVPRRNQNEPIVRA
jgi:hypothetical protein